MKNRFALLCLLALLFGSSCKKDNHNVSCQYTQLTYGSLSYSYQVNESGFLNRIVSANGSYLEYTLSGNILTQQGFDSLGNATGTPRSVTINSLGNIAQLLSGSDTIFYDYNSDGRLTLIKTGINATGGKTEIIYDTQGDVTQMVRYNSSNVIDQITTYQSYSDKPNLTTVFNPLIMGEFPLMLYGRLGKGPAHLFKQSISSHSGTTNIYNFYWEMDAYGNPVKMTVLTQPGNTLAEIQFTLHCSE